MEEALAARTRTRLDALCLTWPDRHVGGEGVRAANKLFAREVAAAGLEVERIGFDCVDWLHGDAWVEVGGVHLSLHPGPYSPPYDGSATLLAIATVEELEAVAVEGAVLLLHGPIAAEQMAPRNYPFYSMEEHQRVYAAIDAARPAAVLAATDRTPMAAALRPFPLFEDGDAGFPSAYLLHTEAEPLIARSGQPARLVIDSQAVPASAEQLVARRGAGRRVIVSAHIDSRHGTPGALDNATGVCVLMALADLLAEQTPAAAVELVPFNGEDNFAAYGEIAYLERHGDELGDVVLVINIDAAGRAGDTTAISFYACPDEIRQAALDVAERHATVAEGPEWPMSDHMVFAMRGVPAMAITSSGLFEISAEVAHTAADLPELADADLIVKAAGYIRDVIERLAG